MVNIHLWTVDSFPQASLRNYYKPDGLKQQFIHSLIILQARSPKSRDPQARAPSEGSKGESIPFLSLVSGATCNPWRFSGLHIRHSQLSASIFKWWSVFLMSCQFNLVFYNKSPSSSLFCLPLPLLGTLVIILGLPE